MQDHVNDLELLPVARAGISSKAVVLLLLVYSFVPPIVGLGSALICITLWPS